MSRIDKKRERERETLFDSHSSPPTHMRALFTQVCKCSFHFFSSAGRKKKTLKKTGRVEPGGGGSRDRDGETERNKENIRSLEVCEVPHVSLCSVFVQRFRCARFSLSALIPGVFVKRGEALGIFLLHLESLSTYKYFSQIRYEGMR